MTPDEAFARWCEICGLEPDDPDSLREYHKAQQSDYEDELANRQRAKEWTTDD